MSRRGVLALSIGCGLALLTPLQASATYPGTNGDIAFTAPDLAKAQVWTMKFLGADKTVITSAPPANFSPSWSADASRIVFIATPPSGIQQIFTMNPDGTLRTQVTTGVRNFDDPSFSPDRKWIVATSWRANTDDKNLWLIKADASGMHRFTRFAANDWGPTFSPDGKTIAWTRVRPNGTSDVCTRKADGSGFHQLTGGNGDDRDADFSPDGSKIVYTHVEGLLDTGRLWTMDADGSHKAKLTNNASGSSYGGAVWAPNGDKVAFIREGDLFHTVPDVFLVNYPGGGGLTNLTDGSYSPTDVDWGVG
jgi:Tol biopolymer transport system component